MYVMRRVKAALMVMMIIMTSNYMVGMEPSRDRSRGLNIKCNIVDLFKLPCPLFSFFA